MNAVFIEVQFTGHQQDAEKVLLMPKCIALREETRGIDSSTEPDVQLYIAGEEGCARPQMPYSVLQRTIVAGGDRSPILDVHG